MYNIRCHKYSDCTNCSNADNNTFSFLDLPPGFVLPKHQRKENGIFFLLEGKAWINSKEHPNTVIETGQFILQAMGTEAEARTITFSKVIIYQFKEPLSPCTNRVQKIEEAAEQPPARQTPMTMHPIIRMYLDSLRIYLEDDMTCRSFIAAKRQELVHLLACYYPIKELSAFYYPIIACSNSFKYFVLQNYQKIKNVEEFAALGKYSVVTFRRIFKNTFGEPAYQWILKQKSNDIYEALQDETLSISDVSYKFGFDSLSHFSNFCKTYFGKSPRALKSKASK